MNQQQWLEWRRGGIGSSDAAAIMGVSPWKTPLQIWEDKVFGISEQLENSAMTRGKDLEETARRSFEETLNTIVFPKNVINSETSWLRASLDGMDMEEKIMVEIKCPNKEDHSLALMQKIPAKYFPQCQHQLAVTGLEGMYYYSFDGRKGAIVEIARDQRYIDELLQKEKQFWDMVVNQIPPEPTERDFASMEEDSEWYALSEKWKETNQRLKSLESDEQDLRTQLIALSKGRSAKGNDLSLSKSIVKGNVDYKTAIGEYLENMRSHYPDIHFPEVALDPYRKKSFTKWTLRAI